MKTCTGCGETKSLEGFYRRSDKRGGFRSRCVACLKAYAEENREPIRVRRAAYYQQNRDRLTALGRRNYHRNPGAMKAQAVAWQRRSRTEHPEVWQMRSRASQTLLRAIKRGDLTRAAQCQECGAEGVPIEGAHHDYARPLDVRWLCRPCHRRWDKAEPKLLKGA